MRSWRPFWQGYLSRYRGFSRGAKLFLLSITLGSMGFSVNWLMLNFYLQSLGYDQTFIGWINALTWLTVAVVGVPIGILSDRVSRVSALRFGTACVGAGATGVALFGAPETLVAFTVLAGLGLATLSANAAPFMAEHSTAAQRTALFSAQAALSTATGFVGNLVGGHLPEAFAGWLGVSAESVLPLRMTLLSVALLQGLAIVPLLSLKTNHPLRAPQGNPKPSLYPEVPTAEPAAVPQPSAHRWRLRHPALFMKLLLPTVLIGLGAGLTMPFLNIFITGKFGIPFGELGLLFALSSLMTAAGMLLQPLLADRMGKARSVVAVQAVSLPFLLMLGFSPYFPLVALAFLVRGMLMNMANPVYLAFCMERIDERERATFSGAQEVIWSSTWAASAAFSGWWRDQVGASIGFDTAFALMALFYAASTILLYALFGRRPEEAGPVTVAEHETEVHIR